MCFPNNRKRCDPAMVPHDQLSVFFQNTQTLKPLEGAQLCQRRDLIQASEPGTTREQTCALFDLLQEHRSPCRFQAGKWCRVQGCAQRPVSAGAGGAGDRKVVDGRPASPVAADFQPTGKAAVLGVAVEHAGPQGLAQRRRESE